MAAIRSRGNKETELRLAAILRTHGITGWRRHQPLPGRPDFIFRRERVAAFVDGCFWHGCRWHCLRLKTIAYRKNKIGGNVLRNRAANKALNKGWRVMWV